MRSKALLAIVGWLAFSEISAKASTVPANGVIDNVSAESAPRLYRNVPVGVYASGAPYAAYSFNVPTFVAKSTQVVPVKVQNASGYLKDSYGQRFIEAPHTVAYKATFPQQFVELQNLPAHLRQPLVAAAPTLQYGQAPHFFGQAQIGVPNIKALSPSGQPQPLIYANNVRSLAPTASFISHFHGNSATQHQPSGNNIIYLNNISPEQVKHLQKEQKFQRFQEEPKILSAASNYNKKLSQQKAQANTLELVQVPKQTSITTVTNGKKTVVNLITRPPVPLLDLTLLEPLTFDNPLVPQVQHFLPRIHQATYKKLEETTPEINDVDEVKQHEMEIVVQKTKTYDSGVVKAKAPKKKQKNEEKFEEVPIVTVTTKTSTSTHELSDEEPEISYEERSPNYRETYTEEKMSYNKKTETQPVNISYNKKTETEPMYYAYDNLTEKKPIHYSYTSAPIKQANHVNNNDNPKHLIYQLSPEEQKKEQEKQQPVAPPQDKSEETSVDTSEESDEDEEQIHLGIPQQVLELVEKYNKKPSTKAAFYNTPEFKQEVYQQYSDDPPTKSAYNAPDNKEQTYHQYSDDPPTKSAYNAPEHKEEVYHQYSDDPPTRSAYNAPENKEQTYHQYTDGPPTKSAYNAPEHKEEVYRKYSDGPAQQHQQQKQHSAPPHPRRPTQDEELEHFQPIEIVEKYNKKPSTKDAYYTPEHKEKNYHQHSDRPEHRQQQQKHHPAPPHPRRPTQDEELEHFQPIEIVEKYNKKPSTKDAYYSPEHKEEVYHQHSDRPEHRQQQQKQHPTQPHPRRPTHDEQEHFQPLSEYEEDIVILPTHKPHSEPKENLNYNKQINHDSQPQQRNHQRDREHLQSYPAKPRTDEKLSRIIIKEGTTAEEDRPNEELLAEMVKKQEESEDDFEQAYKDAAYGFPAYETSVVDHEKEIYNPGSYGAARYQYDVVSSPLRQYEAKGDLNPIFARLEYKDARDKTSDGYYDDYETNKPKSIQQRHQQKEDYYENYKKNTPEKYTAHPSQDEFYEESPQKRQSAKYREAPTAAKYSNKEASPQRDNSAHDSRPFQRYKSKTQFVEPQYQYGFEPVSLSRLLLDSELAAMASNSSPKSEKLSSSKNIYTEKMYYKKTSTAGKAGS